MQLPDAVTLTSPPRPERCRLLGQTVLGDEGAGVIVGVGDAVAGVSIGDVVVCRVDCWADVPDAVAGCRPTATITP